MGPQKDITFLPAACSFGGDGAITLPQDERRVFTPWSSSAGAVFEAHSHAYDKILCCARGSIVFRIPATGQVLAMQPGDRLEIAAGTVHSAETGPYGVTCFESTA